MLESIGGDTAGNVSRSIMRRVLDKELGKKFSWDGKKGNHPLGSSLLGETILGSYTSQLAFFYQFY